MAKRRLTRQQSWRIQKIQDERAARMTKVVRENEEVIDQEGLGAEQEGLVISHQGSQLIIECLHGANAGVRTLCHFRSNLGKLVAGDHVVWCESSTSKKGVVVAVLPRRSALLRPDPYGEMKVVAANIELLGIVVPASPLPSSAVIDRYFAAAELSDIPACLIVNKWDLISPENLAPLEELLAIYRKIGYPIITISAKNRDSLRTLEEFVSNKIVAFVGQSGVGKSSLVNALIPQANAAVGDVSESGLGQHTTTSAQLFHFPQGGALIDSPGVREFGLWHIEADQLINGFIEFLPLMGRCKFRDCKHQREPGCALKAALENKQIAPSRFQNYFAILETLSAKAAK